MPFEYPTTVDIEELIDMKTGCYINLIGSHLPLTTRRLALAREYLRGHTFAASFSSCSVFPMYTQGSQNTRQKRRCYL